jgi:hypothetical protein
LTQCDEGKGVNVNDKNVPSSKIREASFIALDHYTLLIIRSNEVFTPDQRPEFYQIRVFHIFVSFFFVSLFRLVCFVSVVCLFVV